METEFYGRRDGCPKACDMQEAALEEWLRKTQWVQETATCKELGLHRADVLKARLQAALEGLEDLRIERDRLLEENSKLRKDAERWRCAIGASWVLLVGEEGTKWIVQLPKGAGGKTGEPEDAVDETIARKGVHQTPEAETPEQAEISSDAGCGSPAT